jgi:hypothetical protein
MLTALNRASLHRLRRSPALHARRGEIKMPNWVRKLPRGRRYIIPGLIWFAAVALFIAVWIYVILRTDG